MNRNVLICNGLILIVAGIVLGWTETVFYGFNIVSKSTPEAISELTCALVLLIGCVLVIVGKAIPGVPLNLHDTKWPRK